MDTSPEPSSPVFPRLCFSVVSDLDEAIQKGSLVNVLEVSPPSFEFFFFLAATSNHKDRVSLAGSEQGPTVLRTEGTEWEAIHCRTSRHAWLGFPFCQHWLKVLWTSFFIFKRICFCHFTTGNKCVQNTAFGVWNSD